MTVLVLLLALLAVALRWGADTREGRDWQSAPPGQDPWRVVRRR